jgi:hypothetical protein
MSMIPPSNKIYEKGRERERERGHTTPPQKKKLKK